MKKNLMIFAAVLALLSFGMASSAHSFFVSPAVAAAVYIYGLTVLGTAILVDNINDQQSASAQDQDQQEDQTKAQVREVKEKDTQTQADLSAL